MSKQQKEQQLLETVDRIIAEGPYQPAWSSLMQAKTPDWFKQKRFGIFIHWGVYSVPANSNEWYPRNMYIEGMPAYEQHIKTYGSQKDIVFVVDGVFVIGNTGGNKFDNPSFYQFLSLLRVFQLFTDGNSLSGSHQFGQIRVDGMMGEAGKFHVPGRAVGAFGKRDP